MPQPTKSAWCCLRCSFYGIPKKKNPGSGAGWILFTFGGLFVLFMVPEYGTWGLISFVLGILLLLVRASQWIRICPVCKSSDMVPSTSPKGREICNQLNQQ